MSEALREIIQRLRKPRVTHHQVSRDDEPYETVVSVHPVDSLLLKAADAIESLLAAQSEQSAAPAAKEAPPVAGWQLVPIEPTQAMCQAGQWKAQEWPKFPLRISPIYRAMLAAAPAEPAAQALGDESERSDHAVQRPAGES